MPPVVAIAARWLIGVIGAVLMYCSLFLKENEEGRIENLFEKWWMQVGTLRSASMSKEAAFFQKVATSTLNGFELIFGKRLFGPRAIAASICYSIASVTVMSVVINGILDSGHYDPLENATLLICGFVFLAIGLSGPFALRRLKPATWLILVIVVAAGGIPLAAYLARSVPATEEFLDEAYPGLMAMLPLGIACDFLFIAVTRVILRRAANANTVSNILILEFSNFCLAAIMIGLPYFLSQTFDDYSNFLLSLMLSNAFDVLLGSLFFSLAIVMLLHRLIWPILIERPAHALFRYHIVTQQKRLLFFGGLSLLAVAFPAVGSAIRSFLKAFQG